MVAVYGGGGVHAGCGGVVEVYMQHVVLKC